MLKTIGIYLLFVCSVLGESIVPVRTVVDGWTFQVKGAERPTAIHPGESLRSQGFPAPVHGVYRVEIEYPKLQQGFTQGIHLDRIQSADKVYWNGSLIGETGSFEPYIPYWFRPRLYAIPTDLIRPGKNLLEVEIECRESLFLCGLFRGTPKVGDYDSLKEDLIYQDLFQVVIAVLFLGIFVQQAIAYLLNRYSNASLYLALSAIIFVGWRGTLLNKTHYIGLSFELIIRVFYFCQTLFPAFLLLFVYAMFERRLGIFAKCILLGDLVLGFLQLYDFNPDSRIMLVYAWEVLLVLKIPTLIGVLASQFRKSAEATLVLLGALFAAVLGVTDVAVDLLTGKNEFFSQYGLLVFLFSGIMGISIQNARARKDLKKLNDSLETLVQSRTHELEKQYRILNEEILVAGGLQSRLIPGLDGQIAGLSVNSVYVPVEKIGGDYFDFHDYGDGQVQFLLCDVAGHGISAALIASMLKISFLELAPRHPEPADLLTSLNARMVPVVEKNFITAVAALFDTKTGEIRYSLAGHPSPIVLTDSSSLPVFLEGRGPILGWRKEIVLRTWKRDLKKGDRFFFYTDGITEALNAGREMFGEERLLDLLRDSFNRSPRNLNESILSSLREFAGFRLPDDVTYFAVDVI
ncbi:SpoIIE-like protein phosphatase domain protein [Leptospira broomii serovar Hurstbridge str. 5399]|uniref:SpoIIE-like protein phosphatase domain protein n=1 Tax=Leptospira broomii serovar Hurstbridge str. 5399 TaxID=1049789 RepID=T0EZF5_9LEPT|nr:PP2C family protein-serine/threonine phosphatase [Leptospira broomii]EQA44270.1 SpoIIE-like protein phosphatase domain protein [Leptospira broomii serovar Hurstbridge str. 5399]